MINHHEEAVLRNVRSLFGVGTLAGETDRQLLDRFRAGGDGAESAFAVLVERHGPMVLRVCRMTVRESHEIEDAFQATFLVLVRRAGSLWVRDSLGPWLHGVACRVSRHARKIAMRRTAHEERAAREFSLVDSGSLDLIDDRDAGILLHEELGRLPGRYRAPLVLCYLEGMTHEQAAEELRCPVGTVRSRLARGRDQLRKRLVRRGLASAIAGISLSSESLPAHAAVSPRLIETTATAANALARGSSARVASAAALTLTEGVCTMMTLARFKVMGAGLVSLAILGASAGVLAQQDAPQPKNAAPAEAAPTISAAPPAQDPRIDSIIERRGPDLLEIPAPPGATVQLHIVTLDKKIIRCEGTVQQDGRLKIMQRTADPARQEETEIQALRTGILIIPRVSGNLAPPEENRQSANKQALWRDFTPNQGQQSDQEHRLRQVEQKLDQLLQLLKERPTILDPATGRRP